MLRQQKRDGTDATELLPMHLKLVGGRNDPQTHVNRYYGSSEITGLIKR